MTPVVQKPYIEPAIEHLRDDLHREFIPIRDEIAHLAYELWENDPNQARSPQDYWLEAERRLTDAPLKAGG